VSGNTRHSPTEHSASTAHGYYCPQLAIIHFMYQYNLFCFPAITIANFSPSLNHTSFYERFVVYFAFVTVLAVSGGYYDSSFLFAH